MIVLDKPSTDYCYSNTMVNMRYLIKRIFHNVSISPAYFKHYQPTFVQQSFLTSHIRLLSQIRLTPDNLSNDGISKAFGCTEDESRKIVQYLKEAEEQQANCLKNLEYFHNKSITIPTILQNLHLLKIKPGWYFFSQWSLVVNRSFVFIDSTLSNFRCDSVQNRMV